MEIAKFLREPGARAKEKQQTPQPKQTPQRHLPAEGSAEYGRFMAKWMEFSLTLPNFKLSEGGYLAAAEWWDHALVGQVELED